MMWFLPLLFLSAHIEPQASGRLILRSENNNACEGHVEIRYNDTWGYVGDKYWSRNTEEVVCRSTLCGEPVENSAEDMERPIGSTVWLNELQCKGNEDALEKCDWPGWNISYYKKPTVKKIKCSYNVTVTLDGFPCEGAVQYSINGNTGYFCTKELDEKVADLVCQNHGCGRLKELPQPEWMAERKFRNSKKTTIDCSGIDIVQHPWQCVTRESASCQYPASVICTGYERLQLRGNRSNVCSGELEEEKDGKWVPVTNNSIIPDVRCQQMHCGMSSLANYSSANNRLNLTCRGEVNIVLKDKDQESKCYGAVNINVNGSTMPVCGSRWTEKDAEVVCKELNCGYVISNRTTQTKSSGIMDFVKCNGTEFSLWHCQAKIGKDLPCLSSPYVVCSGSVGVELVDGPGKCAGRLSVKHEGQWKRVDKKDWTDAQSDIVCKDLKCGSNRNTDDSQRFGQGSGDFLTVKCKPDSQTISECISSISTNKPTSNQPQQVKAVGITCEEHKVVFLNGSKPCSGEVGIKHGSKIYWLSGSNKTWNQHSADTVCRQMHCGNASDHNFVNAERKDVWNESRNCSSTKESLFECDKTTRPSDHRNTTANVTCKGNITFELTNGCWGNVNFSAEGNWGGICADTWTEEWSKKLCKSLKCGDEVLKAHGRPKKYEILFKSIHTTNQTTDLRQWNFVKKEKNDTSCDQNPAYVVCSGSVKPKFSLSRDKCFGNVEVYYEGKYLPVCKDALNDIKTQNVTCRELGCGDAVGKTLAYFGPTPAGDQVITGLDCSERKNPTSLRECKITSDLSKCKLGGLQCSEWRTMSLGVDKACHGDLTIYSEGKKEFVSSDGWTKTEGERLCQDMKCGNYTRHENISTQKNLFEKNFTCEKNPENIWQCEKQTLSKSSPASKLFIECQDEPKVTLSHKCHGDVRINNMQVCASQWNDDMSHMVCQEHNCSNAVVGQWKGNVSLPGEKYYHVSCDTHHYSLGQCNRIEGKCDGTLVSVYCVNSVKFNTTEKCGGQILINYRNKWEKVCHLGQFSKEKEMQDDLCEKMNCNSSSMRRQPEFEFKVGLETGLQCTKQHKDIRHCIVKRPCQSSPAAIYCDGYVPPPPPTPTPPPPPVVSIIVGVGFLLVLVILIVVFVRFCIMNKGKKFRLPSKILSRKEEDFESGEYEDVNKANEMEEFSQGRFPPEDEFNTVNDAPSTSSLPYDDIDEMTETRPLTSPGATAAATGVDYTHDSVLNQSPDGVTYEVDDPQENYDDIDAIPETMETTAEVHDSPKATTESDTAAASILVEGDDDYLVPGQDG